MQNYGLGICGVSAGNVHSAAMHVGDLVFVCWFRSPDGGAPKGDCTISELALLLWARLMSCETCLQSIRS